MEHFGEEYIRLDRLIETANLEDLKGIIKILEQRTSSRRGKIIMETSLQQIY